MNEQQVLAMLTSTLELFDLTKECNLFVDKWYAQYTIFRYPKGGGEKIIVAECTGQDNAISWLQGFKAV